MTGKGGERGRGRRGEVEAVVEKRKGGARERGDRERKLTWTK